MIYITTAIDYTNAPPHIGHAYEKVLADALARWHRSCKRDVYFLTGVDQHGQKVQQTAEKLGITPAEHASGMTVLFQKLWQRMDVAYDGWAETTSQLHKQCVQKILTNMKDAGELYKKSYKGFYSVRQEQFLSDKDRNEQGEFGAEWGEVVELEEENWYFRLSAHAQWMRDFVSNSSEFVLPAFRKNEVLNAIERAFEQDLCISRPKDRLHWGIEFPFDENFVTYVWFDALINYISFAGYLAEEGSGLPDFSELWPAKYHVIGKDILVPAHAIYWPAMLHAMGFSDEQMPSLLVHGWWNIKGEKMSKSLGNSIDPNDLLDAYGVDALRYYLLRDIATGKDADFDLQRLIGIFNTELANDVGNLANRSLNMLKRYQNSELVAVEYDDELAAELRRSMARCVSDAAQAYEEARISDALQAINAHVTHCNRYIEQTKPFSLAKQPEAAAQLACILYHLSESLGQIALLLQPVVPQASQRLLEQLQAVELYGGVSPQQLSWGQLPAGHVCASPQPVFPRIVVEEQA